MSLNSVQPSYGLQTPLKVGKTGDADASRPASGSGSAANTVRLSDQGKRMSRLSDRVPQTPENVRKLLATLADDLKSLFRQSAIDVRSGIGIEVDAHTGQIGVHGSPLPASGVAALIGSRPEIGHQIQDVAALSRQVLASEQGADSRPVAAARQTAAQIRSIVADYASRFSDENETHNFSLIPGGHAENAVETNRAVAQYAAISGASGAAENVSMVFNGADVRILANGKPWISSSA